MRGLRSLFEMARIDALIDLAAARALPEGGLLCKALFVREAERRLSKAEAALASPSIDKPAVLRFRVPRRVTA
jgi:hypothetical protein